MATVKEWIRDFKRKPKWDRFCIVFTIVFGIAGLIYGGNYAFNIFIDATIDAPTFNISNSSKFVVNYKSPNSPVTITETKLIPGSCGGSVYIKKISIDISDFFSKSFSCEAGSSQGIPDLEYDLFNIKFILPTKQELFIPKMLAEEDDYILAYMNEDYSDACIPHKYRISPDFTENNVCFTIIIGEKVCDDHITISPGTLFKTNKESCYRMVSGEFDFLEIWNPS